MGSYGQKNNTGKMVEMLTRLKSEKNGAVVDSMREKGVSYPLSYGVSVPLIREVARAYYPDHELAKFLYGQDVRELKLASFSIADPELVTPDEISFWSAGVVNSEIAEHLGTVLLSRTSVVEEVLEQWLPSGNMPLVYAVLMAAGAELRFAKEVPSWDWGKYMAVITEPSVGIVSSPERYVWHGLSVFIMNILRTVPESKPAVRRLLVYVCSDGCPCAGHLEAEIRWLLE